ncbi:hypothetical protein QOZ80_2AG0099990 [Eleusine coracana subsp. coracana]|nr:hypothetical protein QOZ80_2AG0099990 [Eleusine coracana subsp. coracana]
MAAAAVATPFPFRKRCATPFLDDQPLRAPKHGRFSPSSAANKRPSSLEFNPLDALRRIFPDADPRDLEAGFHASGRNVHATVAAVRARQAKDAAAARISRADHDDECAAVLVEQMAAAADLADARNIASWILALFKDAVAERATAAMREENNSLKAQMASAASSLKEENNSLKAHAAQSSVEMAKLREENNSLKAQAAALERDNAVLKRGVVVLHTRQEEAERAASEMKKKAAELEMANYALTIRLRDANHCRFQAFRDAF